MKRRMLRGTAWVLGASLTLTVAIVAGLRWWTPSVTSVMWLEPGPPSALEYRPVARAAISSAAAKAVIAAEDQKFMAHSGFDFASLRQSLDQYLAGGQLRGASTISQQVAKNLFLWNGRSYLRKAMEAYFTVLIESLWPKERVLEMYLNIAEFGPGVFGIEAAAQRYLDKPAARLSVTEAALLAAVLPSPKRLSAARPGPHVRARQAEIGAQVRLLEQRGHYAGLEW